LAAGTPTMVRYASVRRSTWLLTTAPETRVQRLWHKRLGAGVGLRVHLTFPSTMRVRLGAFVIRLPVRGPRYRYGGHGQRLRPGDYHLHFRHRKKVSSEPEDAPGCPQRKEVFGSAFETKPLSWSPLTESNRRPSPYHRQPASPCNGRSGLELAIRWLTRAVTSHGERSLAGFCPRTAPHLEPLNCGGQGPRIPTFTV
jgi:hypothetical protein